MNDMLDPLKNPLTYAIPFFAISILIELAALKWLDHDDNLAGYVFKDARTSVLMGLGSIVSMTVFKVLTFGVYTAIFAYASLWQIPGTWWGLAISVVVVDLAYYWNHRFVHRTRVGWAAHQAHHSSEYMTFATALRQKWNPWFEFFFFLPLPFLGISPAAIYIAFSINLIYQFFVHTETIGKLWAPLEWVLNTPSHHRVHHGSDPEYLDKNYAGILIIWDRLFGTFQPERQRPTYGLTYKVDTYNLLRLEYGAFRELWDDVRSADGWRLKLSYAFRPPGWAPAPVGSSRDADRASLP